MWNKIIDDKFKDNLKPIPHYFDQRILTLQSYSFIKLYKLFLFSSSHFCTTQTRIYLKTIKAIRDVVFSGMWFNNDESGNQLPE